MPPAGGLAFAAPQAPRAATRRSNGYAFSVRSNEMAKRKSRKNVFFIDKTAVSAAGRTETRWDYSSVPVLPKPHGLNGIVE